MASHDLAARIVFGEEEELHLRTFGSFGPDGATVEAFQGQFSIDSFVLSNILFIHSSSFISSL